MDTRRERLGRAPILTEQELDIITAFINQKFLENNPADYVDIVDFVFNNFYKSISTNTIAHILARMDAVKIVKGKPMESKRVEVSVSEIEDYYSKLDIILSEGIPAAFFFNVDESGFNDFIDMREKKLVVPCTYNGSIKEFAVQRNSKRATLVGCICLDGTALKPYVVSPNRRVEEAIIEEGYHDATCTIVSQDCGFINMEAFANWADTVFFPEVRRKRIEYGYKGTVIITMDGCTAHSSDYFLDECTYHGVYPVFEPAGSSDQIQPLDLGIFGPQKAMKMSMKRRPGLSYNTSNILNIIDSWHKVTTPSNVVSSFNQAGIFAVSNGDSILAQADINRARAVRGLTHQDIKIKTAHDNKTRPLIHFQ